MRVSSSILAAFLFLLACDSEDPRLPANLYEEARKLHVTGKAQEAQSMMKQLINRYPESKAAQDARKDLYFIDAMLKRETEDRQKQVRASLKRITDALTRYKGNRGEYPLSLQTLAPEYLEQVPESPWGHPFLYKAFVSKPIEKVPVKRGPERQRFNTKLDSYYLACLGTDALPGGEGMAEDILIKDGQPFDEDRAFPPLPQPQPIR